MNFTEMTFDELNKLIKNAKTALTQKEEVMRESGKKKFLASEEGKALKKKHTALLKKSKKFFGKTIKVNVVAHMQLEMNIDSDEENFFDRHGMGCHLFDKSVTGKITDLKGVDKEKKTRLKEMFDQQLDVVLDNACDDVYDLFPEMNQQLTEIAEEFDAIRSNLDRNKISIGELKETV